MTQFSEIVQIGTLKVSPNLFEAWMLGVFLIVLFVLAWIRVSSPQSFSQLGRALLNIRLLRQLIREEGAFASLVSRLLGLCFFLIVALGLYMGVQAFGIYSYGLTGVMLYGMLLVGMIIMYAVKMVGIFLIRFFLGGDYGLNEMIFSLQAHNNMIGLLAFPIVLMVAVVPVEVYDEIAGVTTTVWPKILLGMAATVVVAAYISRLVRGMINSVQLRLSSVYIIFYLCTLEFLPLALLAKVLEG